MPLNLAGDIVFSEPVADCQRAVLWARSRRNGCLVLRETTRRRAGLFRSRQAAIRFAREESRDGNFTSVQCLEGLEFEPLQLERAA